MVIHKLIVFNLVRKLDQKTLEMFRKNHKMIILERKIRIDIKEKNLTKEEGQGQKTNENFLLIDVTKIRFLLIEKMKDCETQKIIKEILMRGHNLEIKGEILGIKEEFRLKDVIKESIHVREDTQEKKIQEIIHQK